MLGPILVLSYKNHALDEFLVDILESYNRKIWHGFLIRTGKPEHEALRKFSERNSAEEFAAQNELCVRLEVQRQARRVAKDWLDCSRSLETIASGIVNIGACDFDVRV